MIEAFFANPYAVLGSILLASFAGFVAWRNNRASRVANASATFRMAFNDALVRLTANQEATSVIIFQNHARHLSAIFTFRPYISWYHRRCFDQAAEEYSLQANIQNAKGPLEALMLDFAPEAQEQRAKLLKTIHKLLSYAAAT